MQSFVMLVTKEHEGDDERSKSVCVPDIPLISYQAAKADGMVTLCGVLPFVPPLGMTWSTARSIL